MASDRKHEHIQLAPESQTLVSVQDQRFFYEPMLAAHPGTTDLSLNFLGKTLRTPIWVSSMTGGTRIAGPINRNIARACSKFGMGMGLGSCRSVLSDRTHWADFDLRDEIGDEQPFWANLGIAQVEEMIRTKTTQGIINLVDSLRADGLIVHVNPMQEWFQLEGNRLRQAPVDTIRQLLELTGLRLIVKEVGQGFGPESIKQLLVLPLEAIEFGAYGGTNFTKLELMRGEPKKYEDDFPFAFIGQSAQQMVGYVNAALNENPNPACKQIIISGGVHHALDGYYLTSVCRLPSVFGMASPVLKHASVSYESLEMYLETQIQALKLAKNFLKINPDYHG